MAGLPAVQSYSVKAVDRSELPECPLDSAGSTEEDVCTVDIKLDTVRVVEATVVDSVKVEVDEEVEVTGQRSSVLSFWQHHIFWPIDQVCEKSAQSKRPRRRASTVRWPAPASRGEAPWASPAAVTAPARSGAW
mmetsp:Transcript_141632/g.394856  ORF Transcript_141632/g.394856 Transcript_141632/m.394856 type:complete len:134 (+) Transcript_141632:708-1109(+)